MLSENLTTVVLFLVTFIVLAAMVRWLVPKLTGIKSNPKYNSDALKVDATLAVEPGVKIHKINVDDDVVLLVTQSNSKSSISCLHLSTNKDFTKVSIAGSQNA